MSTLGKVGVAVAGAAGTGTLVWYRGRWMPVVALKLKIRNANNELADLKRLQATAEKTLREAVETGEREDEHQEMVDNLNREIAKQEGVVQGLNVAYSNLGK